MQMKRNRIVFMSEMSFVHTELVGEVIAAKGYQLVALPTYLPENKKKETQEDALETKFIINFASEVVKYIKNNKVSERDVKVLLFGWDRLWNSEENVRLLRMHLQESNMKMVDVIHMNFREWNIKDIAFLTPRMLKRLIKAVIYADVLARVLQSVRPVERIKNSSNLLMNVWLDYCRKSVRCHGTKMVEKDLASIIFDFNFLRMKKQEKPTLGLVGEIPCISSPDTEMPLIKFFEKKGYKILTPSMMNLILFSAWDEFGRLNEKKKMKWKRLVIKRFIDWVEKCKDIEREAMKDNLEFKSFSRAEELRVKAEVIVPMEKQSGRNWHLAREMMEMLDLGTHLISIQPICEQNGGAKCKNFFKKFKKVYKNADMDIIEYQSIDGMDNNSQMFEKLLDELRKKRIEGKEEAG